MKKFKWVVEFTVDETWVADGFELTAERAMDMLMHDLGYAREDELGTRVLKAPKPEVIRKAQGYSEASS